MDTNDKLNEIKNSFLSSIEGFKEYQENLPEFQTYMEVKRRNQIDLEQNESSNVQLFEARRRDEVLVLRPSDVKVDDQVFLRCSRVYEYNRQDTFRSLPYHIIHREYFRYRKNVGIYGLETIKRNYHIPLDLYVELENSLSVTCKQVKKTLAAAVYRAKKNLIHIFENSKLVVCSECGCACRLQIPSKGYVNENAGDTGHRFEDDIDDQLHEVILESYVKPHKSLTTFDTFDGSLVHTTTYTKSSSLKTHMMLTLEKEQNDIFYLSHGMSGHWSVSKMIKFNK